MLEEYLNDLLSQLRQVRQDLDKLRADLNLPALEHGAGLPPGWQVSVGPKLSWSLPELAADEQAGEDGDEVVSYTLLRKLQLR